MFAKLKEKITESKVAARAETVISPTRTSVLEPSTSAEGHISIGDDMAGAPNSAPSISQFSSIDESIRGSITPWFPIPKSRRSSTSSVLSDVQGTPYHPQSDFDSASEYEEPPGPRPHISSAQLPVALQKAQLGYNKYKGRYVELIRYYQKLERDNAKLKRILTETQDRSLRREAELKEQCALAQQAKAHLEEVLQNDLEEKDHLIATLYTKIQLLKGNESRNSNLVDHEEQEATKTNFEGNLSTRPGNNFLGTGEPNPIHSSLDPNNAGNRTQMDEIVQQLQETKDTVILLTKCELEPVVSAETKQTLRMELEAKKLEIEELQKVLNVIKEEHTAQLLCRRRGVWLTTPISPRTSSVMSKKKKKNNTYQSLTPQQQGDDEVESQKNYTRPSTNKTMSRRLRRAARKNARWEDAASIDNVSVECWDSTDDSTVSEGVRPSVVPQGDKLKQELGKYQREENQTECVKNSEVQEKKTDTDIKCPNSPIQNLISASTKSALDFNRVRSVLINRCQVLEVLFFNEIKINAKMIISLDKFNKTKRSAVKGMKDTEIAWTISTDEYQRQVQARERCIKELEKRLKKAQDESALHYSNLQQELVQAREREKNRAQSMKNFDAERNKMSAKIQNIESKVQELVSSKKKLVEEVAEAHNKEKAVAEESQHLEAKLSAEIAKCAKIKNEIQVLQKSKNRIINHQRQAEASSNKLSQSLRSEIETKAKEIKVLRETLSKATSDKEKQLDSLKKEEATIRKLEARHDETLKAFEVERKEYSSSIDALQVTVEAVTSLKNTLQQELDKADEKNRENSARILELTSQLSLEAEGLIRMKEEILELKEGNKRVLDDKVGLGESYSTVSQMSDAALAAKDTDIKEIEEVSKIVNIENTQLDSNPQQEEVQAQECEKNVAHSVKNFDAERNKMSAKIQNLESRVQELVSSKKKLVEELAEAHNKEQAMAKRSQDLEAKLSAEAERLIQMKEEILELKEGKKKVLDDKIGLDESYSAVSQMSEASLAAKYTEIKANQGVLKKVNIEKMQVDINPQQEEVQSRVREKNRAQSVKNFDAERNKISGKIQNLESRVQELVCPIKKLVEESTEAHYTEQATAQRSQHLEAQLSAEAEGLIQMKEEILELKEGKKKVLDDKVGLGESNTSGCRMSEASLAAKDTEIKEIQEVLKKVNIENTQLGDKIQQQLTMLQELQRKHAQYVKRSEAEQEKLSSSVDDLQMTVDDLTSFEKMLERELNVSNNTNDQLSVCIEKLASQIFLEARGRTQLEAVIRDLKVGKSKIKDKRKHDKHPHTASKQAGHIKPTVKDNEMKELHLALSNIKEEKKLLSDNLQNMTVKFQELQDSHGQCHKTLDDEKEKMFATIKRLEYHIQDLTLSKQKLEEELEEVSAGTVTEVDEVGNRLWTTELQKSGLTNWIDILSATQQQMLAQVEVIARWCRSVENYSVPLPEEFLQSRQEILSRIRDLQSICFSLTDTKRTIVLETVKALSVKSVIIDTLHQNIECLEHNMEVPTKGREVIRTDASTETDMESVETSENGMQSMSLGQQEGTLDQRKDCQDKDNEINRMVSAYSLLEHDKSAMEDRLNSLLTKQAKDHLESHLEITGVKDSLNKTILELENLNLCLENKNHTLLEDNSGLVSRLRIVEDEVEILRLNATNDRAHQLEETPSQLQVCGDQVTPIYTSHLSSSQDGVDLHEDRSVTTNSESMPRPTTVFEVDEKSSLAYEPATDSMSLNAELEVVNEKNRELIREIELQTETYDSLKSKLKDVKKRNSDLKKELEELYKINSSPRSRAAAQEKECQETDIQELEMGKHEMDAHNLLSVLREKDKSIQELHESHRLKIKQLAREFEIEVEKRVEEATQSLQKEFDIQGSDDCAQVTQLKNQVKLFKSMAQHHEKTVSDMQAELQEVIQPKEEEIAQLQEELAKCRTDRVTENREWIKKWRQCSDKELELLKEAHQEEINALSQEWEWERKVHISSDPTPSTSHQELETTNRVAVAAVESGTGTIEILHRQLISKEQEIENLSKKHESEVASLQRLSFKEGDTTKMEYLRNVLFEFMMGHEPTTLVRVLADLVKFNDEQTSKVLQKTKQNQSIFGQLGLS